jgi:hypothetical protein
MNQRAVREWGLNLAEVALYSVLAVGIMLLSFYVPA